MKIVKRILYWFREAVITRVYEKKIKVLNQSILKLDVLYNAEKAKSEKAEKSNKQLQKRIKGMLEHIEDLERALIRADSFCGLTQEMYRKHRQVDSSYDVRLKEIRELKKQLIKR